MAGKDTSDHVYFSSLFPYPPVFPCLMKQTKRASLTLVEKLINQVTIKGTQVTTSRPQQPIQPLQSYYVFNLTCHPFPFIRLRLVL